MGVLAVIGLQIAYPLVHGNVLRDITLATVFVGAATMVFHSYLVYGPLFATTFTVVTFAYSLGIETLGGVSTQLIGPAPSARGAEHR